MKIDSPKIHRSKKVLDGTLAEIKSTHEKGIQVDYDGDGAVFADLKAQGLLERINDSGKTCEMFLVPGVDSQDILKRLVERITVRRFDLSEPSLHEIFVRAVGGEVDE